MEYIVIQDYGLSKEIAGLGQRNIFKAKIKRIYWKQKPVIDRYEVFEKIR